MTTPASSSRSRMTRLAGAASVAICVVAVTPFGAEASSPAPPTDSPAFTATITAERTAVVGGKETALDPQRTITLTVDRTTNLQDQQSLQVQWAGAHPSGDIIGDPASTNSDQTEYPMVLLQCRDVGGATTPVKDRVIPQTCWAPLGDSRLQQNLPAGGSNDVGNYPAWRLDRYATEDDRRQYSGMPLPGTATCPDANDVAEHAVPFKAADGTLYYGSGFATDHACGASPPEAATYSTEGTVSDLPDNSAFTPTLPDGTGSYKFNVRDALTNASLGCSATVSCSLVAIPVMGISCDDSLYNDPPNPDAPDQATNAMKLCTAGGYAEPGSSWQGTNSLAVSGQLWWAASNWRNRIVVPLTFAPVANACDESVLNRAPSIYGSELAAQATAEWSAKLCLLGRVTFNHQAAPEPFSRTLVSTGAIEGALGSDAPDFPFITPTVQAPVAGTGFAVSYTIDDAKGSPFHSLRLTPRLLAKLLTESYPKQNFVADNYTWQPPKPRGKPAPPPVQALKNNPLNITQDPEFQALNPGIAAFGTGLAGVNALVTVSAQSDVLTALTSYINADAEARDWLNGAPDPWGMVVNPNYQNLALPQQNWPLADTWTVPTSLFPADGSCQHNVQPQPPLLPLIGSQLVSMLAVTQAVLYASPADGDACQSTPSPDGTTSYWRYTRAARQRPGHRFVIGLGSLGDARHFSLDTAALQSVSNASPNAQFTDGGGRTFVAPTTETVKAGLKQLVWDDSTGVWDMPYSTLGQKDPLAYPGAMLVYADIPTKGLPTTDARALAGVLRFINTDGQVPGTAVGNLPDGFVPLAASNGFSAMAAYTAEAANHVEAQDGLLPGQHPTTTPTTQPSSPTSSSGATSDAPTPGSTNPGSPGDAAPGGAGNPVKSGGSSSVGSGSTAAAHGPQGVSASRGSSSQSGGSPSLAARATASETTGPRTGVFQVIAILLAVLLLAGPLAAPGILLGRRLRRSR